MPPLQAFQYLRTRKVGEVAPTRPCARLLQRVVLFLAEPEHHTRFRGLLVIVQDGAGASPADATALARQNRLYSAASGCQVSG